MRRRWVVITALCTGLFFALGSPACAGDDFPKSELHLLEIKLKAHRWTLRPPVNRSVCQFVAVEGGFASYSYDDTPVFPPSAPELAEVRGLTRSTLAVVLAFRAGVLSGRIRIEPPAGRTLTKQDVELVVSEIFSDFETRPHPSVVGNLVSRIYHAYASNHLPEESDRLGFATVEAARAAGFRACPVCFVSRPKVSDFETERTLGESWSGEVRRMYPLVSIDDKTAHIDSVGRSVLRGWPVPLRGYEYEFRIVESGVPNAFACPAGHVFVTTGLLASMESEEELRGVLAHEICHVERRHGYRQYKRTQRSELIAAVFGVAVGVATDNGGLAVAAAAMTALASQAIMAGYSRSDEAEADTYALEALAVIDPSTTSRHAAYRGLLLKLQQFESVDGRAIVSSTGFRSHPSIESRISRATAFQPGFFASPQEFRGLDSDGDELVSISIESQAYADYQDVIPGDAVGSSVQQRHFRGAGRSADLTEPRLVRVHELTLFATVVGSPKIEGRVQISAIKVNCKGKVHVMDNREDTELFPSDDAGMSFVSDSESSPLVGELSSLECVVPGVVRWEKVVH